ncbi:unnamed protein product [Ostreobium quekettii]|uniref:Ribosomal RNA-processing protein 42 n=1 Tax=Ostreobium quekettii TaxID=121088 RepID=A0A8S1IUL8_9CHLO|nr:unnamed protein product [Ostreobium quekettii]
MISAGERAYITQCVEGGLRGDGRGCLDHRVTRLDVGTIPQANGSARVQLGGTDVMVGVKVEIGAPLAFRPDSGRVEFNVDFSPCGSPDFEGKEGEVLGADLANALARSVVVGPDGKAGGLDLATLSILPGNSCWVIFVDALILNNDGSLLDAVTMAMRGALAEIRIPHVEITKGDSAEVPEFEIDNEKSSKLDAGAVPIIVTVAKIGRRYLVDLTSEEELCSDFSLHIAVNAEGRVCGVTKKGSTPVHASVMQEMLELAQRIGPKVIESLDAYIVDVLGE